MYYSIPVVTTINDASELQIDNYWTVHGSHLDPYVTCVSVSPVIWEWFLSSSTEVYS